MWKQHTFLIRKLSSCSSSKIVRISFFSLNIFGFWIVGRRKQAMWMLHLGFQDIVLYILPFPTFYRPNNSLSTCENNLWINRQWSEGKLEVTESPKAKVFSPFPFNIMQGWSFRFTHTGKHFQKNSVFGCGKRQLSVDVLRDISKDESFFFFLCLCVCVKTCSVWTGG